jgi:hypothetical protein
MVVANTREAWHLASFKGLILLARHPLFNKAFSDVSPSIYASFRPSHSFSPESAV